MNRICAADGARAILLPRNKRQEAEIRTQHPEWFVTARVKIPEQVVDGLNLMWHSDLVVSGGGTMNREAAALGVPVYSIFRGKIGAVDRHLQAEGRLTLIESVDDVDRKILLVPRTRASRPDAHPRKVLNEIVGYIEEAASAAMASYGRASSRTRTAERGLKPPVRAA
jgi:predicted glycosyltransferase